MTAHDAPSESRADRPVLGIDLGGTKIATVAADATGAVLARVLLDTPAHHGPDAVVQAMADSAWEALRLSGLRAEDVLGAGIGAPGVVDAASGALVEAPNLAGWRSTPVRDLLAHALGVPAVIGNDATVAALGEHRFGAGRGRRHMVYMTVSTGIGGGIVIDGRVYAGATGAAGEIGHIPLVDGGPRCSCGNTGCLEALASGTALARRVREEMARGEPSLLRAAGADLADTDAKDIFQAAAQGDALAQRIIQEGAVYLGMGLTAVVNVLDPVVIVVGGGVAKDWDEYIAPAVEVMRARAFRQPAEAVRVVPAALGADVGALGAAVLALDAFR